MSTTEVGGLDMRVMKYWDDNQMLLPEILGMKPDLLKELIDAIPASNHELIEALTALKYDNADKV